MMETFSGVSAVPQSEVRNRPAAPERSPAEVVMERLEHFADIFRGLQDYVVFSSTAMFLHGQRLGDRLPGEQWAVPPGDFDANFFSEAEWEEAARRLERAGAVFALRGGQAFPGQSIRAHRGTLDGYEFELFLRSDRVVPLETRERIEVLHGLRVVALEDLQRQYERNIEFDRRLWREVQHVASALEALRHDEDAFLEGCHSAQISVEEGHRAVALWERYRLAADDEKAALEKVISHLLGGVKTKNAQRVRNLEQIR